LYIDLKRIETFNMPETGMKLKLKLKLKCGFKCFYTTLFDDRRGASGGEEGKAGATNSVQAPNKDA